jgi:penicillin amidase
MMAMPRAADWFSFEAALRSYHTPGLHVVYADVDGHAAYRTVGTIPIRPCTHGSRSAHDACEWKGAIPFRELPHMIDPESGFISHANNSPVGAWYPYDLYGNGDTGRSWRLREILSSREKFSPADFLSIVHRDAINPIIRDFVRFAVPVAVEDKAALDEAALRKLGAWDGRCVSGASVLQAANAIGATLTRSLRGAGLVREFGGGNAGVAYLLKSLERDRELLKRPDVRRWLVSTLEQALKGGGRGRGSPPTRLAYQNNLENFGSLNPAVDLPIPPLSCVMVETIWSQLGNSYTQLVDLSDVDASLSILPPGISEDPANPHCKDQLELWSRGEAHPAPLSRRAVERIRESGVDLQE